MSINRLEITELDRCLEAIEELQKSLEHDLKQRKHEDKRKSRIEANRSTGTINKNKDSVSGVKPATQNKTDIIESKVIQHFENGLVPNGVPCTDLDELLTVIKKNENETDHNCGEKKSLSNHLTKNFVDTNLSNSINKNRDMVTYASVKSLKQEEHKRALLSRFGPPEKRLAHYSSLPKIVLNEEEENVFVMYKTSSQTNLSQPHSEYKIQLLVHQPNRTIKTILIDELTTAAEICHLLTARNYLMPSIRFALVEKLPHLKIERCFEDHETPVSCLLSNSSISLQQMVFFEDREDKYGMFTDPEKWLGSSFKESDDNSSVAEIFKGPFPQLPSYKSHLFYKNIQRKTWRRRLCVLRNSGLYSVKNFQNSESSDLKLIISLHPSLHLYTTTGGWSNSKAPTPYGFCLKTYGEQNPKYVCYFCALSEEALRYWSSLFRIALNGSTLLYNYEKELQFVADTLNAFQEINLKNMKPHLSVSLGCVTGRSDIQTNL